MKFKIFVLFILFSFTAYPQDTLRIMQYNLLMFGNNFSSCNQSNNSYVTKTANLKTIVNYVKPDILLVNEINESSLYHDYILTHALNVDGINFWERGNPPNHSNSDIVNEIFYNTNKLSLTSNVAIETNVRDIDIFKMKFFLDGQPDHADINCVVAHLKAGNETSDETERANETNKLMNYLHNAGAAGNYTFSGDFNLYTASEQAFQNLLFYSDQNVRFYDPINKIGAWNNNSYYAPYHTQSTHESGDCFSSGGLDDRFDFILVSDEILNGTSYMKYIANSYHAVGQDGEHFNNSVNSSPQNTSVPADVLEALYDLSDHLPVVTEMLVGNDLGVDSWMNQNINLSFQNPVQEEIKMHVTAGEPVGILTELCDLQGTILYSKKFELIKSDNTITIPAFHLVSGIYFLRISNNTDFIITRKVIKY
jgi:hypothetical protein